MRNRSRLIPESRLRFDSQSYYDVQKLTDLEESQLALAGETRAQIPDFRSFVPDAI
jgi:hypothetical protein